MKATETHLHSECSCFGCAVQILSRVCVGVSGLNAELCSEPTSGELLVYTALGSGGFCSRFLKVSITPR